MDQARIEAYKTAWNAHDADRILEYFTDDVVYKDAAMTLCYNGKAELRVFLEKVFHSSSDCRFITENIVLGESGGFWEWIYEGTMTGNFERMECNHKAFSWKGVSVMEFRGDLLARVTDYCLMGEIPNW